MIPELPGRARRRPIRFAVSSLVVSLLGCGDEIPMAPSGARLTTSFLVSADSGAPSWPAASPYLGPGVAGGPVSGRAWDAVLKVAKGKATVRSADGDTETIPIADLLVVADFGEPIYPGLRRLGSLNAGGDNRP